jgi:hypothetical protein
VQGNLNSRRAFVLKSDQQRFERHIGAAPNAGKQRGEEVAAALID